eukprot:g6197.t1
MADEVTDAKQNEITQVKWLTRAQLLTAICYIVTYGIGFRFSIAYVVTSTISPSMLASKDPNIGDKFVTQASYATNIILAQRIINLLTGTSFGELGQSLGRKKLVIIALVGYAVGSVCMLIGFLTSVPDTWEVCYQKCLAGASNATTAESVCVPKCVAEDKEDGSHFNGLPLYIISQGIIGMCSPFAIAASSFVVDVSVDYESFVKNYSHMRAFGYAGGLSGGYFWAILCLVVIYVGMKNTSGFIITAFTSGIVFGTVGALMGGLMLKEPLTEEKKKKCCGNPVDYLFCSAYSFPLKQGNYTFFLWLANAMYAFFFAYWESTATHYFLWNYGVNVVIVMVAVVVVFLAQLFAIKFIVPRLGFRRAIYFGYPIFVAGVLMLALTRRGPNDTAKSQPTGLIVVFVGGLLYAGNGCLQSSMLALYNSQGGPKDTGPLGGAWKTGEATFKLIGSICAAAFYPGHVARVNADPNILPVYTIIGGWGATAKAGDYATAKAGDIATASENVTVVTATTEKA